MIWSYIVVCLLDDYVNRNEIESTLHIWFPFFPTHYAFINQFSYNHLQIVYKIMHFASIGQSVQKV